MRSYNRPADFSSRTSMGFNSRFDASPRMGSSNGIKPMPRKQKAVPEIPAIQSNDLDYFDVVTKKPSVKNSGPSAKNYGSQSARPQYVKSSSKLGLPKVGCMPGCCHDHKHCFEQDYTKNHWDPIEERPGYFHEFNQELDQRKEEFDMGKGEQTV